MNAAAPSWRVATTRMPAASRPSSRPRKLSPGTVKAKRTPTARRVARDQPATVVGRGGRRWRRRPGSAAGSASAARLSVGRGVDSDAASRRRPRWPRRAPLGSAGVGAPVGLGRRGLRRGSGRSGSVARFGDRGVGASRLGHGRSRPARPLAARTASVRRPARVGLRSGSSSLRSARGSRSTSAPGQSPARLGSGSVGVSVGASRPGRNVASRLLRRPADGGPSGPVPADRGGLAWLSRGGRGDRVMMPRTRPAMITS